MIQDTDAKRIQIRDRLNGSGFKPQRIDQILRIIDAMMTGRATLAHVLVAVAEVCKVCELDRTHQHVGAALACLTGEVLQRQAPSSAALVDTTDAMRGEVPPWTVRKDHSPWIRAWSSGSWRSLKDAAMNVDIAFEEEAPQAVRAKKFDC